MQSQSQASGSSTFVVRIQVPRGEGRSDEEASEARDAFYNVIWEHYGGDGGLVGIHEGTVLSEQAVELGLETESYTVDAAEAPRERDWIGSQQLIEASLYFSSRTLAEAFVSSFPRLGRTSGSRLLEGPDGLIAEQPAQDWDREWRASFLGSSSGIRVPPFWRIIPPWVSREEAKLGTGEIPLKINPGAGFGTGTHETTQLCLESIAECMRGRSGLKVLDFGSGSGILSIGSALIGAQVWAVEIDPLANDNALDNARLNQVEDRIQICEKLENLVGAPQQFELVVANILRPVLEAFAQVLVDRMKPGGVLILSGLVAEDLDRILAAYGPKLPGRVARVTERGDWRCVSWR